MLRGTKAFKPHFGRSADARPKPVTLHTIIPLQHRNREQAAEIGDSKLPTMISTLVFTATAYTTPFGLPTASSCSSSTSGVQNSLETGCPCTAASCELNGDD